MNESDRMRAYRGTLPIANELGTTTDVLKRLFEATAKRGDWVERAACRGMNPSLFFAEKSANCGRYGGNHDTAEAVKVCQGCEVKAECLQFALDIKERDGVFGGLTPKQRAQLRRVA